MEYVSLGTEVLVLVVDETIESTLARGTDVHGWSLLRASTLRQAVKHIQVNVPKLFIVQVVDPADQALELIRMLRSHFPKVPLIAVAFCDEQQIELSVRQAGAYCYFPDAADPEHLAQMVAAMLTHH